MSADHIAVLVASIACATVTIVLVVAVIGLARRVRDLRSVVEELRHEALPLVRDARVMADQAATELVRVGDVLGSAEAVSTTVDSASRLAYRMFSNPAVKVLAYGTGMGSALRRFFGRNPRRAVRTEVHPNGLERGNGASRGVLRTEEEAARSPRRPRLQTR